MTLELGDRFHLAGTSAVWARSLVDRDDGRKAVAARENAQNVMGALGAVLDKPTPASVILARVDQTLARAFFDDARDEAALTAAQRARTILKATDPVRDVLARDCMSRSAFEVLTSRWSALVLIALTEQPYRFNDRLNIDLVAKSGDRLLENEAVDALRSLLVPLSTIVTPNLPEASVLLRCEPVCSVEDMRARRGLRMLLVRFAPGEIPVPPPELWLTERERRDDRTFLFEHRGELSPLLQWLGTTPVEDVAIGTEDLRSLYDQFHGPNAADEE